MEITHEHFDPVAVVRVRGKFIGEQKGFNKEILAVFDRLLAAGERLFLVHLDIEFINSTGLAALYAAWDRCRRAGAVMACYSAHPRIQRIFRVVMGDHWSFLYATEDEAMAYLVRERRELREGGEGRESGDGGDGEDGEDGGEGADGGHGGDRSGEPS